MDRIKVSITLLTEHSSEVPQTRPSAHKLVGVPLHSGRWIKQQLRTVKVQSLCGPCSHKGTCLSCPCPHASETIMEEGLNGLKKPEMGNWVKVISERTKPLCSLPHSSCGCLHKMCASTSHSAQCACSVGRKEPAAAASCWKKGGSCRLAMPPCMVPNP